MNTDYGDILNDLFEDTPDVSNEEGVNLAKIKPEDPEGIDLAEKEEKVKQKKLKAKIGNTKSHIKIKGSLADYMSELLQKKEKKKLKKDKVLVYSVGTKEDAELITGAISNNKIIDAVFIPAGEKSVASLEDSTAAYLKIKDIPIITTEDDLQNYINGCYEDD